MKIELPLYDNYERGRTLIAKAEIVHDLAPHTAHFATWAVHRKPWGSLLPWRVSNVETGFAVGPADAADRAACIKNARKFLGAKTADEIEKRIQDAVVMVMS